MSLPFDREPIDCQMCHNVTKIDVVHEQDMNEDLFMEKYAFSGRPLLVKNATNDWSAMVTFDFEFFRDLFEDLNSPVLDNVEEDCQFFAWDFKEFSNVQVELYFIFCLAEHSSYLWLP